MSSKLDMLKNASESSFAGLYIDNAPRQAKTNNEVIPPQPIVKEEAKPKKETELKMMAFRLPLDIVDKINKYAYVERLTNQEVATLCFKEFFNKKERKESLSEYDEIKK